MPVVLFSFYLGVCGHEGTYTKPDHSTVLESALCKNTVQYTSVQTYDRAPCMQIVHHDSTVQRH